MVEWGALHRTRWKWTMMPLKVRYTLALAPVYNGKRDGLTY